MQTNPESNSKTQTTLRTQKQLFNNSYPLSLCLWETSYMLFSFYLCFELIKQTIKFHQSPLPTLLGFIIAQLVVDFVSGLMHWACDTWGKFETPIFGPTLIRSFRTHHVDPQEITRHSFLQTNAASSYPMPFVLAIGFWTNSGTFLSQTLNWTFIFAIPLGILTNQFHKWSHMVHTKPHPFIVFLQKSGFVISHEKHTIHHQGKFDTNYCIINGWMNPFLEKINFWRRVEAFITKCTGAVPREDDNFWRNCKRQ